MKEGLQHKKEVERIPEMMTERSSGITVILWPKRNSGPGWKKEEKGPRKEVFRF